MISQKRRKRIFLVSYDDRDRYFEIETGICKLKLLKSLIEIGMFELKLSQKLYRDRNFLTEAFKFLLEIGIFESRLKKVEMKIGI